MCALLLLRIPANSDDSSCCIFTCTGRGSNSPRHCGRRVRDDDHRRRSREPARAPAVDARARFGMERLLRHLCDARRLLLAFVVSAIRVDENNPSLWTNLKTGEMTANSLPGCDGLVLLFRNRSAMGQYSLAFPVEPCHGLQSGEQLGSSRSRGSHRQRSFRRTACHRRPDRDQCLGTTDHGVDLADDPAALGRAFGGRLFVWRLHWGRFLDRSESCPEASPDLVL